MNIVFCASEVVPFAKTGGLADVCGALPPALEKLGHNVIIITPRYAASKSKIRYTVERLGKNISVYFIEHDGYFGRPGLYGENGVDYKDNLERFSFFCHAVLKLLKDIKFCPDIIHCHDWHTSLIPALLKTKFRQDAFFNGTKSILTIHNLAYQGLFPKDQYAKLGVEGHLFHTQGLEFYDQINVLKGGIIFADAITTVSPQYSKEIQTWQFGCGLDGVLRNRALDIYGILNGLDYEAWDPSTDALLPFKYSPSDLDGKAKCKEDLQRTLRLPENARTPMCGLVARLCHQKGVDLIVEALEDIVNLGAQVVFTGVGDKKYQVMLENAVRRFPEHVALHYAFDEPIAHRVYAASDFFFMPSVFEPCGLGQMIALRYGSIPIVHRTGGLADTIKLYNPIAQTGNGFLFSNYTKAGFYYAVKEAVRVFRNHKQMDVLVQQAFRYCFSWEKSAKEYIKVYEQCLSA